MRLNKFISDSGLCSRREADKMVETGRVTVNGRRAEAGMQVTGTDTVRVDGEVIASGRETVYIAFNKPAGVTCTTDRGEKSNIIDHVNYPDRIFNIGRLDKDSEGLIFLTNDGDIVNKILRAGNKHEKEYVVTVNKPVTDEFISGMSGGVPMLGVMTRKCKIIRESAFVFRITLTQGLNRQIRRMCEHFGYEVTKLVRVRIMNITLQGLPTGDWRFFSAIELAEIKRLTEASESAPKSKAAPKKSDPEKSAKPHTVRSKPASKYPPKSGASHGEKPEKPTGGRPKVAKGGGRNGKGRPTSGGSSHHMQQSKKGGKRR